jgi:NADH:ubiquinone oxidoreductase subunit 3 (subunit A)
MYFNVRYYLVAILFILFDLEVAFVFPWAVVRQFIIALVVKYATNILPSKTH